jgi:hypothetical protein
MFPSNEVNGSTPLGKTYYVYRFNINSEFLIFRAQIRSCAYLTRKGLNYRLYQRCFSLSRFVNSVFPFSDCIFVWVLSEARSASPRLICRPGLDGVGCRAWSGASDTQVDVEFPFFELHCIRLSPSLRASLPLCPRVASWFS